MLTPHAADERITIGRDSGNRIPVIAINPFPIIKGEDCLT